MCSLNHSTNVSASKCFINFTIRVSAPFLNPHYHSQFSNTQSSHSPWHKEAYMKGRINDPAEVQREGGICPRVFYADTYGAAGIEGEREAGSPGQLADVSREPDPSWPWALFAVKTKKTKKNKSHFNVKNNESDVFNIRLDSASKRNTSNEAEVIKRSEGEWIITIWAVKKNQNNLGSDFCSFMFITRPWKLEETSKKCRLLVS